MKTDYGTSYFYDMVTDFNGVPSITLTEFATQCRYEENVAILRQLLKKLKCYPLDNHIVTMLPKPQNILCQRISESEVVPVVCGNLGESTLYSAGDLVKMVLRIQTGESVAVIYRPA